MVTEHFLSTPGILVLKTVMRFLADSWFVYDKEPREFARYTHVVSAQCKSKLVFFPF